MNDPLRWHYADGILTVTTQRGASVAIGDEFAAVAVNLIARIETEGGDLQTLLNGLYLVGCASEAGRVTLQGADGLPPLPARAREKGGIHGRP